MLKLHVRVRFRAPLLSDDKAPCLLCVQYRRILPGEQVWYTSAELTEHILISEGDSPGHPFCNHCDKPFYDDQHLKEHINSNHCPCPLCPPRMDRDVIWKDSLALEWHFVRDHFCCFYCKNVIRGFVDIHELRKHSLTEHGIANLTVHEYQRQQKKALATLNCADGISAIYVRPGWEHSLIDDDVIFPRKTFAFERLRLL